MKSFEKQLMMQRKRHKVKKRGFYLPPPLGLIGTTLNAVALANFVSSGAEDCYCRKLPKMYLAKQWSNFNELEGNTNQVT